MMINFLAFLRRIMLCRTFFLVADAKANRGTRGGGRGSAPRGLFSHCSMAGKTTRPSTLCRKKDSTLS
jgi:hypothetical protein